MILGPGQAQRTSRQQHQHHRLPGSLHSFQQFLLPAGQVDIVAVAVLAAGAAESGVPLGILAQHQDIDIGRCGFRTSQPDAVIGNIADFSTEAEGIHRRSRSNVADTFQHGHHILGRLRSGPVTQNRLAVGIRPAHEEFPDLCSCPAGRRLVAGK